ncbi:YbgA family protein [Thermodesulfobacteriota bacterium]
MEERIKIGISRCLLGDKVRYDGGHKKDRFLTDTLSMYVDYVPVCPEVEAGFPVPREAFRLVGDPERPVMITSKTRKDVTELMKKWAQKRVKELEEESLCGFIFKKDSPSSGMERVKVYNDKGMPQKKGVGIFAGLFTDHFPLIPVEEEGRLHDPALRENFIERIFTLKIWRKTLDLGKSMANILDFHTRHKLLIMAHSVKHYRLMGRLIAVGKGRPLSELYKEYEELLMEALKLKATVKKSTNVLQHMMGYFKKQLSSFEKKELNEIIDQYRREYIPLIVPITLINHYVKKYEQEYLMKQVYLNPHPVELKLRNHS